MTLSIYDASIPWFLQALGNLGNVLDKAAAHCEKEKIDPNALLTARLYPDMFPLTRQVQSVSDQCKGGAARLAGVEAPKFPDGEGSFAELKARLEKTAGFLTELDKSRFDDAGSKPIEAKFPQTTLKFASGWTYLLGFVVPNIYFHSATSYDILRHNGVKLGKQDFIGAIR